MMFAPGDRVVCETGEDQGFPSGDLLIGRVVATGPYDDGTLWVIVDHGDLDRRLYGGTEVHDASV